MSRDDAVALPTITPWLLRGFLRYVRRYVRKHFHAVRVLRDAEPDLPDGVPLLVVLNHASWWDPLACFFLHDQFAGFRSRRHYAPIDAEMLEKYGVFRRLGFFGVEQDTRKGAREFLQHGRATLSGEGSAERALWVTAQGRFADVRERPVHLRPGVAHLIERLQRHASADDTEGADVPRPLVALLPLAIEYVFWEQRTPELLFAFGPMRVVGHDPREPATVDAWQQRLTADLAATMDRLADAAMQRDAEAFRSLGAGRAGVGGLYDAARALRARLTGRAFDARHG